MGASCSTDYFHRRKEFGANLSGERYKRFPIKHKAMPCQVVLQLTGEGLVGASSPFDVNEHVSVRYHYQYQIVFAPNDDSNLVYGVVVEQTSLALPFQRNPNFGSTLRIWNLATSGPTTTTRVCTVTSGPWSVSPNGRYLCSQASGHYREEDLFLAACKAGIQPCIPCEFSGVINEYRRLYPQACPFSPDGTMIASAFGSLTGLQILIIQPVSFNVLYSVKASNQCKGFKGIIVSCVFSPDSEFLAVISSRGQIYMLRSAGLKLECYLDTTKSLKPLEDYEAQDITRSEPCILDFDPRSPHYIFAACSIYRGLIKIWEIGRSSQSKFKALLEIAFDRVVNMIKYAPNGDFLAIAGNEGLVTCVDSDEGSTLFELSTAIQSPQFRSTAGIFHLAFSRCQGQLAASYSDGFIRIWKLPVEINLQNLCRLAVNEVVPGNKIQLLPVPQKMRNYLLYKTY